MAWVEGILPEMRDRNSSSCSFANFRYAVVFARETGNVTSPDSATSDQVDYFAFCDQDDVWLPEKLFAGTQHLTAFPENRPALYCSNLTLVTQNLEPIGIMPVFARENPTRAEVILEHIGTGCTMVFNQAALRKYQQSLNEVFATRLHEQQRFPHYTRYSLVQVQTDGNIEGIGCMCYDFCSENIECISAWELLQTVKVRQKESYYYPLKNVCLELGMDEEAFTRFLDYQIMTDYLISNTDRHMNNIAVMRDPDTLRLLGFAPIYDSGNSMFYNTPYEKLSYIKLDEIRTHSFVERENRLLHYVRDRLLVDIVKAEIDFSIYEMDVVERQIRIPLLKKLYYRKIENLKSFQKGKDLWKKY